jgi:hypothetical protein
MDSVENAMQVSEEAKRPRSVTLIGWVWLIFAIVAALKSAVSLIVWKVIQPAVPALIGDAAAQSPRLSFLRPLFAYMTELTIIRIVVWIGIAAAAVALLRLRPWARVAIQAVCATALVYVAGFTVLWGLSFGILQKDPPAGPSVPGSYRTIGLALGLGICLAAAAGLVTIIALLRKPETRAAFRPTTDPDRGD